MTLGTLEQTSALLRASSGGAVLNTAIIPRFNGTMRERLASLTRRCRHAAGRLETLEAEMHLIGCTYNFCWPYQELSQASACWAGVYASYGKWIGRSRLEGKRPFGVSVGPNSLGGTATSRPSPLPTDA